ncbi:hypothetical protein B0H13DRAFT_1995263 [Mycena leptocephala]|nr:hypothetical protein B0H13DRAFT_1995263 [Mycena leptocephala]
MSYQGDVESSPLLHLHAARGLVPPPAYTSVCRSAQKRRPHPGPLGAHFPRRHVALQDPASGSGSETRGGFPSVAWTWMLTDGTDCLTSRRCRLRGRCTASAWTSVYSYAFVGERSIRRRIVCADSTSIHRYIWHTVRAVHNGRGPPVRHRIVAAGCPAALRLVDFPYVVPSP